MKKIVLPFLLMIAFSAQAQWSFYKDTINFESVNNSMIKIDTAQPNNLWQIGKPHKVIFDSAYSIPNVIVTDTINNYPINNTSSFQFTIYDSGYVLGTLPQWNNGLTEFSFWQKLDTDTLHDGGYIEFSVDSGQTFTNVANVVPWIYNNGVLYDGTPGFTGKPDFINISSGWQQKNFEIWWCSGDGGFPIPHSAIFRFTFKSDSINNNREGWMIDDITISTWICEGINEQTKTAAVSIFPNPASSTFTIESSTKIENLKVINVVGERMYEAEINAAKTEIDVNRLPKGIYFLRLTDENKQVVNKKLVVE